jgi:ketosteroid isomerase-like protein
MRTSTIIVSVLLLISGCAQNKIDTKKVCAELIEVDSLFSDYSIAHGKNAAFLKFAAEDVTFLAPNNYPLVGIKLLEERQAKRPDTTYTLRWKPIYARAAESGDLGYTYGTWELMINNTNPEQVTRGTYATIWKRNENGEWKYVLDTGQEGLGEDKK